MTLKHPSSLLLGHLYDKFKITEFFDCDTYIPEKVLSTALAPLQLLQLLRKTIRSNAPKIILEVSPRRKVVFLEDIIQAYLSLQDNASQYRKSGNSKLKTEFLTLDMIALE